MQKNDNKNIIILNKNNLNSFINNFEILNNLNEISSNNNNTIKDIKENINKVNENNNIKNNINTTLNNTNISLNTSKNNENITKTNKNINNNKLNKLDINSEFIFYDKKETIFINQITQDSLKSNFDLIKKNYNLINEQVLKDFQILNLKSFKDLNKYINLNIKDQKNIFNLIKTIQQKLKNEIKLSNVQFLDNQEYIFNLDLNKFYEITDFVLLCLTVLIENKKLLKPNYLIDLIEKKIKFYKIFSKFPNYHQDNPNLNGLTLNILSYCIQILEKTTEINFNLGSNKEINETYNDKNFFYRLFILSLFFNSIFPNVLKFRIDLNIYEIIEKNNLLNGNDKLYQMKIDEIIKDNEKYYKIFIANYIFIEIINKISISNDALFLNIKHFDDYIIEINDCYKNELNLFLEPNLINLRYYHTYFNLHNLFDLSRRMSRSN